MADGQINKLLEFANFQMAAEAFLTRPGDAIPNRPEQGDIETRLRDGNFHTNKFTPIQADKFVADYEVVTQFRNDSLMAGGTGFSATLFKNKATGELTLSFRSTEFIDDAARDNKATNELEIKDLGWAFGQIADMESWYKNTLLGAGGPLVGKNFSVTGYSLGGHLATAFNILRREEYAMTPALNPITATYTFNGAGTGQILNNRRLTDLLADFNRIRTNYTTSPEWLALAEGEKNYFSLQAQTRVDAIAAERFRVAGLQNLNPSFNTSGPSGIQLSLGYQIAALLVSRDTRGAFAVNPFPNQPIFAAQRFANMTEVVGMETGGAATSFVSNSGIHYGTRQEVAIEAQPLYRGDFPVASITNIFKLIGNDPGKNDFADTHSLVLLVDSLSLMAAMEKLAPTITIESAKQIFAAMSSAASDQSFNTQGKAEGDTLEKMLDALRKLVLSPDLYPTLTEDEMKKVLEGNTWHDAALRAKFQTNLKELRDSINSHVANNSAPFTIDNLTTIGSTQLASIAGSSEAIAYRYALQELNPFAILKDTAAVDFYLPKNLRGIGISKALFA